jgi:hypothetical protein
MLMARDKARKRNGLWYVCPYYERHLPRNVAEIIAHWFLRRQGANWHGTVARGQDECIQMLHVASTVYPRPCSRPRPCFFESKRRFAPQKGVEYHRVEPAHRETGTQPSMTVTCSGSVSSIDCSESVVVIDIQLFFRRHLYTPGLTASASAFSPGSPNSLSTSNLQSLSPPT